MKRPILWGSMLLVVVLLFGSPFAASANTPNIPNQIGAGADGSFPGSVSGGGNAGLLDGPIVTECAMKDSFFGFTGACQLCDLAGLASRLIQFAVAFSVVVATLMFTYAGVLYFTAAASEGNIKKAHEIFWKVFGGLIIILIAWLVVDLLLKTITGGQIGPWHSIDCEEYKQGLPLAQYQGALSPQAPVVVGGGGATNARSTASVCPGTCTALQLQGSGGSCLRAPGSNQCLVTADTNTKLTAMNNALGGDMRVTSGLEPAPPPGRRCGTHCAQCHHSNNTLSGSCIDVVMANENMRDPANILRNTQAARDQGLQAVFESNDANVIQQIRTEALRRGITLQRCDVLHVPHASGDHYSVYNKSGSCVN